MDEAVDEEDRRKRFEEFFRDHYDAVLAYAASRADLDTAKDAVAATFLVAWRRHGEERDHPLPWLFGVTRKTLAEQRRSASRLAALRRKLGAQPHRSAAATSPVEGTLLEALEHLREPDRELLRLTAWEQLDPAEIGEVLGCSRRVAIVRLHRARRRLRAALAELDGAEVEPDERGPVHDVESEEP